MLAKPPISEVLGRLNPIPAGVNAAPTLPAE
jgi:hypothetical protein